MLSVGSAFRMDSLLGYIKQTQNAMGQYEAQVASGRKAQSFSTQPEPVKMVNLKATVARTEQFLENGLNASTRLAVAEKSIDNVQDVGSEVLKELQLLLSPSFDPIQSDALKTLATGSMKSIVAALNAQADDGYVFGGLDSNRPPVQLDRELDDPSWKAIDTTELPSPYPTGLGDLDAAYFYFLDGPYAMDPAEFSYPPAHNIPPTSDTTAQVLHLYHTQYYKGDLGVSYGDTGPAFAIDNPGAMSVAMDPADWGVAANVASSVTYTVDAVENPLASGVFDVTVTDGAITSNTISVDTNLGPAAGANQVFTLAGAGPQGTDTILQLDIAGMSTGAGPFASTLSATGFQPATAGIADPGLRVRIDTDATVPVGFSAAESGFEKLMLGMHILTLKDQPVETEDPVFDVANDADTANHMTVSIDAEDLVAATNIPNRAVYTVSAEADPANPGNFLIQLTDDRGGTSQQIQVPQVGSQNLVFEIAGGAGDGARIRVDIAGPIQAQDQSTITAKQIRPRLDIDPGGAGTLDLSADDGDLAQVRNMPTNTTLTFSSTAGTAAGTVQVTVTDSRTGLSTSIDNIDPLVPADLQNRTFSIPGAGTAGSSLEVRFDLAGTLAAGQTTTVEGYQPPDFDQQVSDYTGWMRKAHELIDDGLKEIREIHARATSAQIEVENTRTRLVDVKVLQANLLEKYEAADTTEAIVTLQKLELQLQASYEVTSRIGQLNLVNFL